MDDGARRARRVGDPPRVPGAGRRWGERSQTPLRLTTMGLERATARPGGHRRRRTPLIGAAHAAPAKGLRAAHGVELTTTGA